MRVASFELVSGISLHDIACKHWSEEFHKHLGWTVDLDPLVGWLTVRHPDGRVAWVPAHMLQHVLEAPSLTQEGPEPLAEAEPLPLPKTPTSEAPVKRRTKGK